MNKEPIPPYVQLGIMSRDYVISRSIHAIASLGIADYMSEKPVTAAELAKKTGTLPDYLERLLNFLTVYGLFKKCPQGYSLTALSKPLREDDPSSMKHVLNMVDDSWWQAFSNLETVLKTGTSGFEQQHGVSFFQFMNTHPEKKTNFEKGLKKLSSMDDKAIIQSFDFGKFQRITDVGSGKENLAKGIKVMYPAVEIGWFDVIAQINEESNNLFLGLPQTDAYLLKGILHDFNDEMVVNILKNLRLSMVAGSSLVVAEQTIAEDNLPHTNKTMDIIMMVLVGGHQRTGGSWQELIESTGFKLKGIYPTKGIYTVLEFV